MSLRIVTRSRAAGPTLSCLLFLCPTTAAQVSYQNLGHLPGRLGLDYTVPLAISDDGNVIIGDVLILDGGNQHWVAFRWTPETGMQPLLPDLPAGSGSHARDISADGSVIVGGIGFPTGDPRGGQAFRWTQTDGLTLLGDLPGGPARPGSGAAAISADGTVIVGSGSSDFGTETFRWTAESGLVPLGDFPGGLVQSGAGDVSRDGSVLSGFGVIGPDDSRQAFRWTASDGMVGLGYLPTPPDVTPNSYASSMSADGSVIACYSNSMDRHAHRGDVEACRWTAGEGMVSLGSLVPAGYSTADAISADGSFIFGKAQTQTPAGSRTRGFVWSESAGMRDLTVFMQESFGFFLGEAFLSYPMAVTADGLTIVGWNEGGPPELGAWRLRVDFPCPTDLDNNDRVDLADLATLLAHFGESGPGLPGDLDTDGDVDLADLGALLSSFGVDCRW